MNKQYSYEKSHPWIRYSLDLRDTDYKIWIKLGRARSLIEGISGIPLMPQVQKKLQMIYLAKGALATTAIEGNTLSEEEVIKYLNEELQLPQSKEYMGQEIKNIVDACNLISKEIFKNNYSNLCQEQILQFNEMVMKDLPKNEEVIPGKIRSYDVFVGRYKAPPAEDCQYLLEKLCSWINEEIGIIKGYELEFAIIRAIITHLYIAWIHPFGDGNGRTARLLEFQILLNEGGTNNSRSSSIQSLQFNPIRILSAIRYFFEK